MAAERDKEAGKRAAYHLDQVYGAVDICRDTVAEISEMLCAPEQREEILAERTAILDRYVFGLDLQRELRGLRAIEAFLRTPSRQTLRTVLADSSLAYADEGQRLIGEQLADFERHAAARVASLPKPSEVELATFILQHKDRIVLAIMHVELGYGVTAIARLKSKSRSTVYAAIRFFQELPEEMQAAIRNRLCSGQVRETSATEPADRRVTNPVVAPSVARHGVVKPSAVSTCV